MNGSIERLKVFVTGGSGFIGSAVMDALIESGAQPANFDVKAPLHMRHSPLWLPGDILDRDSLVRSVNAVRPDAIIHLAAKADIIADQWADFASIHEGTANLLSAAEGCGEVKRFLNISTQMVMAPGHAPRTLTDFQPYTVYGEAKAFAEELLLRWETDIAWLTVRPTNIWGPHHPSFAEAIWKYIDQRYYLHPTGKPVFRTYGFVDNMADQIVSLLGADPARTARGIYYGGDAVLDSAVWVDAFSVALTGRSARRVPAGLLRLLGNVGDLLNGIGIRSPIDSGRAMRLTQSYGMPIDATLEITGPPRVSLAEGVDKSVAWLRSVEPRFGSRNSET